MRIYIKLVREMFDAISSGYNLSQKINFLKCLLSKRGEVLRYDPVTISIVATTRCTLACDMCPTHSSRVPKDYVHAQKNRQDITFDMFKEMIDRFKNGMFVHIIGSGEPLLNKDFFRMVDYAASKKMTVKTFSNGTTVGDNIDNILNSGLDGITVSINGHNAEEFHRMTGMDRGVYLKIYNDVKRLAREKEERKAKVKVKLSFIIDKDNYRMIPEMIKTAMVLGADHAFFCNFLPSPYDGLAAGERILTKDTAIIREIKDIFKRCPASFRRKVTPPVLVDTKTKNNNCDTHFTQIRFDGDGNVSSCSMMLLNMTGHGNYKDEDIWNNDFFKNMRRAFLKSGEGDLPEPCSVCPDNRGVWIGE